MAPGPSRVLQDEGPFQPPFPGKKHLLIYHLMWAGWKLLPRLGVQSVLCGPEQGASLQITAWSLAFFLPMLQGLSIPGSSGPSPARSRGHRAVPQGQCLPFPGRPCWNSEAEASI